MGKEIVYCSVCGDRIPASDFEKGKAATILQKHFCRKCAVTVVKQASEGSSHDPTVTPRPFRINTARIPLADKPVGAGSRTPFLIAAAIGLLALGLLLYVLFGK